TVKEKLGNAKVFTFGIDTAVNEFFLKKLAEIGHGSAEFLLPDQKQIEPAINRFQARLSGSVLNNLYIESGGLSDTDFFPNPLPDLFINQPIFVIGKFHQGGKLLIALHGMSGKGPMSQLFPIDTTTSNADLRALSALWGRYRIEQLTDTLRDKPADQ